jgi:hypothetical protein
VELTTSLFQQDLPAVMDAAATIPDLRDQGSRTGAIGKVDHADVFGHRARIERPADTVLAQRRCVDDDVE